jgi:LPS sulfotransferase NodH
MRPWRSYLICGVPRSGSSFVAGLLRSTGVAGFPEEYFWRNDVPVWRERWNAATDRQYLDAALDAGTSPNGVFGARVMWGYFSDMTALVGGAIGIPGTPPFDVLTTALPGLRLVHIVRLDHLAQAVSWAKAIQTGRWNAADRVERTTPTFDPQLIQQLLNEIAEGEAGWDAFLRGSDVPWTRIVYEDVVARPEETVGDILRFLNVDAPDVAIDATTEKQADDVNEQWIRRFLSEAGPIRNRPDDDAHWRA